MALALFELCAILIGMKEFIFSNLSWFWFGLTVICVIIEAMTLNLTTIWFALGAIVLVFLSFTPIPFAYQVLIFLAISIVLMIFTRPIALTKFKAGREKTNSDSLIGKTVLVTKAIKAYEKGEVKVAGMFWSAQTIDEVELEEGIECVVEKIEGVTMFVRPSK